jgi:mitochondrial fission protein ELM1
MNVAPAIDHTIDHARAPSCWIVTDGKVGMTNQCLGLADALGLKPVLKRVRLRTPWRDLTPYFRFGGRMQFTQRSDRLEPPWPDLLIATGRHSVAASILVRRLSRGATRTVQIQNPVISLHHFDLVVTPRHDNLAGSNVMLTRGALHRVTPALLKEGADSLGWRLQHLKRPYITVLIGGSNAVYKLDAETMRSLADRLASAARAVKASLLITPSRRTGEENVELLRDALVDVPHYMWLGHGDNPYFGLLGLADYIVATSDSVNMVSEAASTGKPVYVAKLPGGSPKFNAFHDRLVAEGVTRVFEDKFESYTYEPLDDVSAVAAKVRTLLRH